MADAKRTLYEELILEHAKNPRNLRTMENPDHVGKACNPMCGDSVTLFVKSDGNTITDLSFDGKGCAIAKAAYSVVSVCLVGKTLDEAEAMAAQFQAMVTSEPGTPVDGGALGDLAAFAGVREFPGRYTCATVPWRALMKALGRKMPAADDV